MKSCAAIVMLTTGLLLSGCADFGKGTPAHSSTWNYTFGRGVVKRPAPPKEPSEPMPPSVRDVEPAPNVEPIPNVEPTPSLEPITMVKPNPNIDWDHVERKEQPAHPPQQTSAGANIVSRTYPCDSGVLRLDKEMPGEVQINTPFEYTIKVINETRKAVENVVVREHVAHNFRVLGSYPQALIEQDTLVWRLGTVEGRSYELIRVKGVATTMTRVAQCATMTFGNPVCVATDVIKPELILIKLLPDKASICDTIPMRIGVKNIGSGTAQNVAIHDVLPTGLRSVKGEGELTFNVGALESGQAREFTADLKATRPGEYQNKATATASNAAPVESALVGVTIGQPVLEIKKAGPSKQLLGSPLRYQITVKNSGRVIAQDLVLEDEIPAGMAPFKTNYGGKVVDGKMIWHLPSLQPGDALVVEIVYKASQEGAYTSRALARATCADPVSAVTETAVKGIAAILLEVMDIEDPIELGGYETYLISATSQGTSDNTNVHIVCTLEDNVEYASAEGPTLPTVHGRTVEFEALPRLAPKKKATWKVVVRAVEAGDVRFKVTLTTDQLQRPVEETESTEMYE